MLQFFRRVRSIAYSACVFKNTQFGVFWAGRRAALPRMLTDPVKSPNITVTTRPLPRAALLLILALQAKFGVPLNPRVFLCLQRLKSCGCHR